MAWNANPLILLNWICFNEYIENKILKGSSDDEIYIDLQQKYGDFILYKPPLRSYTMILWVLPYLLLLLVSCYAWTIFRTSRRINKA